MQRLPARQALRVRDEAGHMALDRPVLLVGANDVLGLAPQRVHRVQLRRPLSSTARMLATPGLPSMLRRLTSPNAPRTKEIRRGRRPSLVKRPLSWKRFGYSQGPPSSPAGSGMEQETGICVASGQI